MHTQLYGCFFFLKIWSPLYLNHLSTFELLYVTELSSFANQFAPLHRDSALCLWRWYTSEMYQNVTKAGSHQKGQQTLSFLPSMVVISASLPMVKELVTVFPGVLEVTTKSLPFCLISVIGLMSLAILMTSSGSSGIKNTHLLNLFTERKQRGLVLVLFLTHGLEELLVVLLGINLPCSIEVHV